MSQNFKADCAFSYTDIRDTHTKLSDKKQSVRGDESREQKQKKVNRDIKRKIPFTQKLQINKGSVARSISRQYLVIPSQHLLCPTKIVVFTLPSSKLFTRV